MSLAEAALLRARGPGRIPAAQHRRDGPARRRDARDAGSRRRRVRLRQQHPRPGGDGRRRRRVSHSRASCPRTSGRCSAKARGRSAGRRCRAIPKTSASPIAPRSRCSPTTSRCAGGSGWPASGSRSRACRRASAGSATASARGSACASTSWCAPARVKAPIVIGRDHLDTGSVASPNRETEGMRDGSDAIADWPILNALLNASAGATWVSVHHGGGVGIGYSLHAGMVIVADGSAEADEKLRRVLTCDPGIGVARHADAGYPEAIRTARERGVSIPMLEHTRPMMAPHDGLERRVLAALEATPARIPVVLGGCGTGRSTLLHGARRSLRPIGVPVHRRRALGQYARALPPRGGVARRRSSRRFRCRRRPRARGVRSHAAAADADAGRAPGHVSCSTRSSSCARSRASRACATCCARRSTRWRRAATDSC